MIGSFSAGPIMAQAFINPGFESGTTGWTCQMEVNSASVYGGTGSNKVAEVDGHTNASSTADDRLLCQTLSGFTVGSVYALEFDATRRASASTPATVTVTVSVSGALSTTVTRTGGWNMVRERLYFTATSTSHALSITPNFTTSFGMLFDNFNIYVSSPLPIELVRFDARPVANVVEIDWATASERNNALFRVERSVDLDYWEAVAEVAGAGDSQIMKTYGVLDNAPMEGLSYYRLKQVDLDGTEAISAVRTVNFSNRSSELFVWPNPAIDRISVQLDEEGASARLFNAIGQLLTVAQERNGNMIVLDVASLPAGSYYVRCTSAHARTASFVKQ
ncbi:MAG: T9SS type A sorting domain-containing protein [Flavobacteriales bacterium]|nr:T9SS type A sorting domain-containing protein [Flavobacteriales bacterium]